LILCGLLLVLQAAISDCGLFDPFSLQQDGLGASEADVGPLIVKMHNRKSRNEQGTTRHQDERRVIKGLVADSDEAGHAFQ
jgi:hypothetical protein